MTLIVFYLLSIVSILSGILTITGKNPINSVVYLVTCFGNSALIFMLMGVDLLGLIYIIVYVGAIAILFIFVIMMMDLRILSPVIFRKSFNFPLLFLILSSFILGNLNFNPTEIFLFDLTTWEIAERNIWESLIQNSMNNIIQSVGYLLYTDFLSLLLLASLILLMVMISVIILIG